MNRVWLTRNQLDAITGIAWVVIAVVIGLAVHRVLYWLFARWAERRNSTFAAAVVRRTCRPAAYIFPLVALLAAVPQLDLPSAWTRPALHVTGLLTVAAVAWTIIATVRLFGDIVIARHRIDVEDNLAARQLGTRVDILTRVVVTLVIVIALGAMLMTFPPIRALGTTLLASAGVLGLVAGIAARPLFENLIAGVQLALTQPIRIDDVVIVEKQFGRIEEIHSTYVVVRIWDLRRMVLPLTYFITTPFENWTRRTANLVGEVYLFADYTVDVGALRAQLPRILEGTPLWDGQTHQVEVTDATDRAVQIRALVSARDSGTLWDLRCFVREALVAYLRETQADALPRVRLAETARGETPPPRTGNDGATRAEQHSGE
ncbi:MAG TPA: mechanosensitive ion channel domain-containing protein [Candidatus Elarobacter sp.]